MGHAVASIAGEPQISDFTPGNDDPDSAPGSGQGITSTPGIAQGDGMKPLDPTLFCKDNPVWVISGGGQELVDDPDAADPATAPQITRDELVLRNVRRALNGIFEPDYNKQNNADLYDGANGYIDLLLTGVTKLPMRDPNSSWGALHRYRQLRSISMPEVTETGENAFAYCSALTSVSLPKATDIGISAFYDCHALKSVSLPEATDIRDYAFSYCRALTYVSLPEATDIGISAFEYCSALTYISLPEATDIRDYAFSYCRALTYVSLPEATDIGISAFEYCSALTYISLPEATDIGKNAFSTCSALKSISLPEATDIGNYAFRECRALTRLDISGVTDSGNLGSNIFVNAVTTNCDLILSKTMYDDWNVNGGTYALYRYWKTITYK
ncbi:leucine-rich repeat domain-containing protein [Bacteroides sp. GD17]|uniref:leucine-rich repeat domain-containing protein n=1 Tax=Bacteroides sp. GD17 TaxID=3139826 RepID=UPI00313B183A